MWLLLVIFVLLILYYLVQYHLGYWKRRNIPGPKPKLLVGNIGKSLIGLKSMGEIVTDIYKKYEDYPIVGIYKGSTPSLIIRDPDFIKTITVKEFKSFQNNDFDIDKEVDPLFGRNPFVLKGEEWKKSRSQLTPCFTSGKMKQVYPLIEEVSKRMVKFVTNEIENAKTSTIEAKELCTKFTLDNVAACAFGIEGKCFEDPKSKFRVLAHKFLSPDSWTAFKFLLSELVPKITTFLSIKLVPKVVEEELMDLVKETIRYREENNIVRNDFLDFVRHLRKTTPHFTDVDIVAHTASFFVDGYETSSLVMSFVLFLLAMNSDVQEKLRKEINNSFEQNNGQFSYESIQEMTYLDACLNEALRKYPPVFFMAKRCTERYTYESSNPGFKKISVTVEPGTPVLFPVGGLNDDEKYFYSPDKYIPERFLEKDNINRYVFLPFGEGPRACLGQRFGTMQIKVGVVHLVKHFEIKLNKKTQLPLKFDPWNFLLQPIGGLWLDYYKI